MAGGDYALIKSVERFEDNKYYGERQLEELNFCKDDLLIGVTEGGETSFVIGTIEKAATLSKYQPYFIYCNSDEKLIKIDRSLELIQREDIKKINLTVGEMALSGSTRMQASTVQMLAVGFAVLYKIKSLDEFSRKYKEFVCSLCDTKFSGITSLIESEEQIYKSGGVVTYEVPSELAITVLTDTTERCPTFNLAPFEKLDDNELSLSHLCIEGLEDNKECWQLLLGRAPRDLNWNELNHEVCLEEILKFNLSSNNLKHRLKVNSKMKKINIYNHVDCIGLELGPNCFNLELGQPHLFFRHMVLKLALNIHSTLVMGRLNRFEGNMMTYVRPSNMKLIDRCIRYIKQLLLVAGKDIPEKLIIEKLFEELEQCTKVPTGKNASIINNQGIVIRVRDKFLE
jgi:N-acetylmuramic acid 6-phosphate etherase